MSNNTEIQTSYEAQISDEFKAISDEIESLKSGASNLIHRAAGCAALIATLHESKHKGGDARSWLIPLIGEQFSEAVFLFVGRAAKIKAKDAALNNGGQMLFAFEAIWGDQSPHIEHGERPKSHETSPFAAFTLDLLRIQRTLAPFRQVAPPKKWGQAEADQIIPLLKDVADYIAEVKEAGWL
jgi:hypothetical protein